MVVLEAANKVLEHIAAGVLFIITCKIFAFSIGFAGGQKIYSLLFCFPLSWNLAFYMNFYMKLYAGVGGVFHLHGKISLFLLLFWRICRH